MGQIIFHDGTELDALVVNGNSRFFQGSNRDTLEFQFAKNSITFDELDEIFASKEKTEKIMIQQNKERFAHHHYSLRVSMSLLPIVIEQATDSAEAVVEERYSVVMAQKTYAELLLESLQETVDLLVLQSLEG